MKKKKIERIIWIIFVTIMAISTIGFLALPFFGQK